MLIKTREPGPRAKISKKDLFPIAYGAVRTGTPLRLGTVISYRFFRRDVEALARLVHGDVEAHMKAKRAQLRERRSKRRKEVHKQLKIRNHEERLAGAWSQRAEEYHQSRAYR